MQSIKCERVKRVRYSAYLSVVSQHCVKLVITNVFLAPLLQSCQPASIVLTECLAAFLVCPALSNHTQTSLPLTTPAAVAAHYLLIRFSFCLTGLLQKLPQSGSRKGKGKKVKVGFLYSAAYTVEPEQHASQSRSGS